MISDPDEILGALAPHVGHPEVRDLVRRAIVEERRTDNGFPDGIELGPLFADFNPTTMLSIARTMSAYARDMRNRHHPQCYPCNMYIFGLFMGIYIPSIKAFCIDTDVCNIPTSPEQYTSSVLHYHPNSNVRNKFTICSEVFPDRRFFMFCHRLGLQIRENGMDSLEIGSNVYFDVEDGIAHYLSHVDIGPDFVRITYPTPRGPLVVSGSTAMLGEEVGEVRLESGIMIAEVGGREFCLVNRQALCR